MDSTEKLVSQYLSHRFPGGKRIEYEPDGNIPPDFLVDGRIAVEVRRLNEHDRDRASPRGLEEGEIPLVRRLQQLLESYGSTDGSTRLISLRFSRPLPDWSSVESGTRRFLGGLERVDEPNRVSVPVAPNVELEWIGDAADMGAAFHLAVTSDEDSGGWVIQELERNLRLCLDEKAEKVRPHRHKYPEWWLLLVDRVAFGLSEHDQVRFQKAFEITHEWDRVVLVSALDHKCAFEL